MRMNAAVAGLAASLILVGFAGCGDDAPNNGPDPEDLKDESDQVDGKADAWDARNDPDRFSRGLNYALDELPLSGRSEHEAWPSTYWPTYQDSVNVRWNGDHTPAQLYDIAFNGWTPAEGFGELRPFESGNCAEDSWDEEYYDSLGPLATHVSANMGNKRSRDGVDSDGDGEVDECDDNDGVATWWGLCHAWVPAAMLEDRPLRAVTWNGVTFETGDLEALLILAYNRSPADMIGGRCNELSTREDAARQLGCRLPELEAGDSDSRDECTEQQLAGYVIERDDHGRADEDECRDTNPGALHIIMTNYLGLQHRAFAEDRTWDLQVWNQPVVAYNVSKQEEITIERANELLDATGDTYPFNADAAKLYEVEATMTYITESHASTTPADASRFERNDRYTYILEVDADGEVIGGEYFGDSREDHPDFLWSPRALTRSSVPNLDLENVRMLVRMSREAEPVVNGDVIVADGAGGLAIPDNNATGVSGTATVSDGVFVGSLNVVLDVEHTYIGDLKIVLSHGGVERVIHNNEGGSDNNINRTIPVQGFEGADASGVWTLTVVDSAAQDTGSVKSWKLQIVPAEGAPEPEGEVEESGAGGAIPDDNADGISRTIAVDEAGTVDGVEVAVKITHTYIGDLTVTLSHGGVSHVLHNKDGGSRDDIDKVYTVHAFDGQDAAGEWVLSIVDSAAQDTGTLGFLESGRQSERWRAAAAGNRARGIPG